MVELPSFRRHFSGDPRSRSGHSQFGRLQVCENAKDKLVSMGYSEIQAQRIVWDTQDYAKLIFLAS